MIDRIFFTQPFRRWIIRLSLTLPGDSRLVAWLDARLYPTDAEVMFP